MPLRVAPCTIKQANDYVAMFHRHSGRTVGHLWSTAVVDHHGLVHGVSITGRPLARMLQDGATFEVLRVCTNGTPNACSMLYSAAWRAARAMGYWRGITYIRDDELGTSLKASGWRPVAAVAGGRSWNSEGRYRESTRKATVRWEVTTGDAPPATVWPKVLEQHPVLFGDEHG